MNWKKILRYFLIFLILIISGGYFFSQRELDRIFGGLTKEVPAGRLVPDTAPVYIRNISVLSPEGDRFIPGQSVLIKDGLIVSIDSIFNINETARIIDGEGKYLIPGLIDSHVHLYRSANDLLLYIANGITGIREMDGLERHLIWRNEIKTGERVGPDMYVTSPRVGSFDYFEGIFIENTQGMRSVTTEKEARLLVEEMKEKGFDGIKVYSQMNREAFATINELAPKVGLDVVGHIPYRVGLDLFIDAKYKGVAHLEELMKPDLSAAGGLRGINTQAKADSFLTILENHMKDLAPQIASKNISVTTTLWLMESFVRQLFDLEKLLGEVSLPYANPGITEWNENIPGLGWLEKVNRYKNRFTHYKTPEEKAHLKLFWNTYAEGCRVILRTLRDSGVTILAGTDANVPVAVPGFSLHDEMISMHKAGLTTTEVIRSATVLPGQWLNNSTGVLQEGFRANLLLLNNDPLQDLNNTRNIDGVIYDGRFYDRNALDNILAAVKEANDESRRVDIY